MNLALKALIGNVPGDAYPFAQPAVLRQSSVGLHFIFTQNPPAAKRRLAQTLNAGTRAPSEFTNSPRPEFPR